MACFGVELEGSLPYTHTGWGILGILPHRDTASPSKKDVLVGKWAQVWKLDKGMWHIN